MMQRKIYYWHAVVGDEALQDAFRQKIDLLMQGETKAADLDLKKLPGHRLYSIKLNRENRLLLTTVNINGKHCLAVLEVILNHDYQKSRFLKPGVLEHFLDTHLSMFSQQINEESFLTESALEVLTDTSSQYEFASLEFYNQRFIELNTTQREVLRGSLPLVVSGPPGSGKSCVALAILKQCAAHLTEHDDPILYITESALLVNNLESQWRASPALNIDKIMFRTYDQLLREIQDLEGQTQAGKEVIEAWIHEYIAKQKTLSKTQPLKLSPAFFQKTNEIYQEFRILSAVSHSEKYFQLGQRQCLFHTVEEKAWLWTAYHRCLENLASRKLYHPAFTPVKIQSQYNCIVVDEAQDLSSLQLTVLARLAQHSQICYCMDSHQSLADNKSKRPFLLELIRELTGKMAEPIDLPYTYRCPENITRVANTLITIKTHLTGGIADKYEQTRIELAPGVQQTAGQVHWLSPSSLTEADQLWLSNLAASNQFAVVTLPEYRMEARKLFNTPLIFTPDQIKGLEYETVVGYRLFDTPICEQANPLIKSIEDAHAKTHRAKRDEAEDHFGPHFNQIFVVCTRAMRTLIIYQEHRREIAYLTHYLLKNSAPVAIKREQRAEPPTPTDWHEEAKRQAAQGNILQAEDIYRNKLNGTEEKTSKSLVSEPAIPVAIAKTSPHPPLPKSSTQLQDYLETIFSKESFTEKNISHLLFNKKAARLLFDITMKNGDCLFLNINATPAFRQKFESFLSRNRSLLQAFIHIIAHPPAELQGLIERLISSTELGAFLTLASRTTLSTADSPPEKISTVHTMQTGMTRDQIKLETLFPNGHITKSSLITFFSGKEVIRLLFDVIMNNGTTLYQHIMHDTELVNVFDTHTHLLNQFTAKVLHLAPDHYKHDNLSVFQVLCATKFGKELLILLFSRKKKIIKELNINLLLHTSSFSKVRTLSLLSTTDQGRKIVEQLINQHPHFAKEVTPEIVCEIYSDTTRDGLSLLAGLAYSEEGQTILLKLLKTRALLKGITTAALCTLARDRSDPSKCNSPLFMLTGTVQGLKILTLILNANPALAEEIPSSALFQQIKYSVKNSGFSEQIESMGVSSAFLHLSTTLEGIQILITLFNSNPRLLADIKTDDLLLEYQGGYHMRTFALYWLGSSEESCGLLLTMFTVRPELLSCISVEVWFRQVVLCNRSDSKNDSIFLKLLALSSGEKIISLLIKHNKTFVQEITAETLSRESTVGVNKGISPLYSLIIFNNKILWQLIEAQPKIAQGIRATMLGLSNPQSNTKHYILRHLILNEENQKILLRLLTLNPDLISQIEVGALGKFSHRTDAPPIPYLYYLIKTATGCDILNLLILNDPNAVSELSLQFFNARTASNPAGGVLGWWEIATLPLGNHFLLTMHDQHPAFFKSMTLEHIKNLPENIGATDKNIQKLLLALHTNPHIAADVRTALGAKIPKPMPSTLVQHSLFQENHGTPKDPEEENSLKRTL